MQRVDLIDFVLIAEDHCGIEARQLMRMPVVVRLAESALAAPFAGFGDFELFPSFYAKAAVYMARIATYHPLPDGNKRTAYDVMREFVERNGGTFSHEADDFDRTAEVIERVAAQTMSEDDLTAWMTHRLSGPPGWPDDLER